MILELALAAALVNLQGPNMETLTVEIDDELEANYQADNKMYWRGKLPSVPVGWADLKDANAMTFWYDRKPQFIAIDNSLKDNQSVAACALIHEETHVKLGPKELGDKFTRTMFDAVKRGGCSGLFRHKAEK